MEDIVIIGLGQIGGSIGMALKQAKLRSAQIIGVDIDRGVAAKAQRKGAVDSTERLRAEVVEDAALVIVATPILAMKEVFQEIATSLPVGCVVTDTGSTKEQILKWAEDLLPHHVSFVGGHPMAGREIQGIDGADPNLFNERPYCIVPSLNASKGAVQLVVDMVDAIKGVPYFVDAPEHDVLVGGI
ncbi:MAG: Prephenate dehydrogenase, partial [Dehalococcoidia bacterium]|nr:Prephenate dehydrogenase [Dehalococcoidia bacterium]